MSAIRADVVAVVAKALAVAPTASLANLRDHLDDAADRDLFDLATYAELRATRSFLRLEVDLAERARDALSELIAMAEPYMAGTRLTVAEAADLMPAEMRARFVELMDEVAFVEVRR